MTGAHLLGEKMCYNGLNIATRGNFSRLSSLHKKYKSWNAAWDAHRDENPRETISPEREWEQLEKKGVAMYLPGEAAFPPYLREVPLAPHALYSLGPLPILPFPIAVVGTRRASEEGRETARIFSRELAARGAQVISGLAFGIDCAAHMGCIEGAGITIAVLATGLEEITPRSNEKIAQKIIAAGGAVVSERPFGAPLQLYNFLQRNRIVSGMSRGVLLVEVPEKSGACATARYAIDQNRDVFVVPGAISNPRFAYSNRIIKEGAMLVTNPSDILEHYGVTVENGAKNGKLFALETDEERSVASVLEKAGCPLHIDKIADLTKLKVHEASRVISMLIIKNAIKETEKGFTL